MRTRILVRQAKRTVSISQRSQGRPRSAILNRFAICRSKVLGSPRFSAAGSGTSSRPLGNASDYHRRPALDFIAGSVPRGWDRARTISRGRCGLRPAHTLTDEEIDRRPPGGHVVRIGLRAIGQQLVVFR